MTDFIKTQSAKFYKEDVVITDPCYVIPDELWHPEKIKLATGKGIEDLLGIKNYIWGNTEVGDWSCVVTEVEELPEETSEEVVVLGEEGELGSFGADAGLVAVFSANDIPSSGIKYSLDELQAIGLATVIKQFTGTVSLMVADDFVSVMGKGESYRDSICFFSH